MDELKIAKTLEETLNRMELLVQETSEISSGYEPYEESNETPYVEIEVVLDEDNLDKTGAFDNYESIELARRDSDDVLKQMAYWDSIEKRCQEAISKVMNDNFTEYDCLMDDFYYRNKKWAYVFKIYEVSIKEDGYYTADSKYDERLDREKALAGIKDFGLSSSETQQNARSLTREITNTMLGMGALLEDLKDEEVDPEYLKLLTENFQDIRNKCDKFRVDLTDVILGKK